MTAFVTAREMGLLPCGQCGLLCRAGAGAGDALACPRCGAALHARKPDSLARTWAFLIAAMVLYVPANMLTVMRTDSLFGAEDHTFDEWPAEATRSLLLAALTHAPSAVLDRWAKTADEELATHARYAAEDTAEATEAA